MDLDELMILDVIHENHRWIYFWTMDDKVLVFRKEGEIILPELQLNVLYKQWRKEIFPSVFVVDISDDDCDYFWTKSYSELRETCGIPVGRKVWRYLLDHAR